MQHTIYVMKKDFLTGESKKVKVQVSQIKLLESAESGKNEDGSSEVKRAIGQLGNKFAIK